MAAADQGDLLGAAPFCDHNREGVRIVTPDSIAFRVGRIFFDPEAFFRAFIKEAKGVGGIHTHDAA
mgnify:FL=1